MSAYLLILFALVSRLMVASHPGWLNFTAIGGSLLFFGARRSLREMALPLLALAAMDYYLTAFFYNYPFHAQEYILTWTWYVAVAVLGHLILRQHQSVSRVAAGVVLSSTSFFLASNFAAWEGLRAMYPHTFSGLMTAYAAGLPFYRNDLLSTGIVVGFAFGLPALMRQLNGNAESETHSHKAA